MKRIRYMMLFLVAIVAILQACSENKIVDDTSDVIPIIKQAELITVLDLDGNIVVEHREPDVINKLLQGMKDAQPSYIGDPEQSGDQYELVISGGDESRTFSLNDLRVTNTLDASVKVYAALSNEERAKAWKLKTAWIELLLNPKVSEEEARLIVTVDDEVSDSVILVANRDIDQQSIKDSIQSTLSVRTNATDTPTDYMMHVTDSRRIVIRFSNLPEGAKAEFNLDRIKTKEGEQFHIVYPYDSSLIVIHQGVAWSGLRWIDTTGLTVKEHGFDSAGLIQPLHYEEYNQEIVVYNDNNTAYLLDLEKRDIADITIAEWVDDEVKYSAMYGVRLLYSYSAEKDVFYAAKGLETIYRINVADETKQAIYKSERPIYGMASSPDGGHIAILVDSEMNLGPYADLLIIDDKGKVVSEFTKAADIGHSEGWHFIYPVAWTDSDTIAVPLIGSAGETFLRGNALFHYKEGLLLKRGSKALPEDAATLLESAIGMVDELDIIMVLPKSHDENERYYAVYVAGYGGYLIDREDKKVTLISSGELVTWTSTGQIVAWHSTEGKYLDVVGIEYMNE